MGQIQEFVFSFNEVVQGGIDANVGPVTKRKSSVSLALYAAFLDNAKSSLN